jgi:protein TonB
VQVVTPGEATDDAVRLTRAYRSNLTALALVALFTGAFLVFATQSLAVARRRREIALLHAMGMKRDPGSPAERELQERHRQLLQQLAEIEKRINTENARPKRRYVSPATREAVYAIYYDRLRRKIEDRGTRDFPEVAGRKLYGELTMNLTVDAAGRVVDLEIVRASRTRGLDQRAVAIVRAAAPFGPFSDEMAAQADQIVVTSRFRFTRDDGLETTLSASEAGGR